MLQVQTPVAVVDTNVQRRSSKTKAATIKAAHAFVDYLYSPGAQADFAAAGFRYVRICAVVLVPVTPPASGHYLGASFGGAGCHLEAFVRPLSGGQPPFRGV